MEDHRITKINSAAFKHLIFMDIGIESFLRDVDLFCTDDDMTEDAKAVYREKRKELIANLPYSTTFALTPGDMNVRRIEYRYSGSVVSVHYMGDSRRRCLVNQGRLKLLLRHIAIRGGNRHKAETLFACK